MQCPCRNRCSNTDVAGACYPYLFCWRGIVGKQPYIISAIANYHLIRCTDINNAQVCCSCSIPYPKPAIIASNDGGGASCTINMQECLWSRRPDADVARSPLYPHILSSSELESHVIYPACRTTKN